MWGSIFFLGFGREVGQEANVILWKCMGGGVEIVNFFSIDCERSRVHIYISARGFWVEKTVFFFFFWGFCFAHLPKEFFLVFFFLVIMRPQAIPVRIFSFLLIFLFFLVFFLGLLKGIFFPLFSSSHLSSESSFSALFHIILLTEGFLWFFGRIYWLYLFIHFYLFV